MYCVTRRTHFSLETLSTGLTLEQAKMKVDEAVERHHSYVDDGIGQTVRTIENPPLYPYSVKIQTMTAEAGECLDLFSVELEDNPDA